MKFISAIPFVSALVGIASAGPLEARGDHGGKISYTRWSPWENRDTHYSCDSSGYDYANRCCRSEKKCWYDPWDCRWECCDAHTWDWNHGCPTYYVGRKDDHQKRYNYYGGGNADCHKRYDDDRGRGHHSDYLRGGQWKKWH